MSDFGQKLRTITGILTAILLVVRLLMLLTGGSHRSVSYNLPPVAPEPPAPQTEAERQAADEQRKSFAAAMAAAREFAYGQKSQSLNAPSHQ